MTFQVPKLSGDEFNFFSQRTASAGVRKSPVSFGSLTQKSAGSTSLQKDLDEIASFGAKKENGETYGLGGAPTPAFNCGKNLWAYC